MSRTAFVDACVAGQAMLTDVDAWVHEWHLGDPDDVGGSLAAHLGMSEDEYALWVERPEVLRFIVAAHKRKTRVADLLLGRSGLMAAARAEDSYEAAQVMRWLIATGRIDGPES